MKKTTYYNLLKPEGTDAVDINNFNDNFDTIDAALKQAADASGDLSKGTVYASQATSRTNVASGDTIGTVIGKIMKWFADLKSSAFCEVANNDSTTASGYVADARAVKAHGDEIDTLNTKMGGLYFGQNATGKWGYKTSANGTVNPFRNPTGNAGAGDVLVGKTFANESSDALTGTMPNNGAINQTLTPSGDNSVSYTIPAGYTSGGTITANGSTAYKAGASSLYDNDIIYGATMINYDDNSWGRGKAAIQIPNGFTKLTIDTETNNLGYKLGNELSEIVADSSLDGTLTAGQTVNISGYKYVAIGCSGTGVASTIDPLLIAKWHISK